MNLIKFYFAFIFLFFLSCKPDLFLKDSVSTYNADNGNNITEEDHEPDMIVIGQKDFYGKNYYGTYPSGNSFFTPSSITKTGTSIIVSDFNNNRVLIFDNGLSSAPSVVIGQKDPDSLGQTITDSKTLNGPAQLTTYDNKLILADSANNRVLIWNTMPASNGKEADVVIGQNNFEDNSANMELTGPNEYSLNYPFGVAVSGTGELYISDMMNNRILYYSSIPEVNHASADAVIGQDDFYSTDRTGPSDISFLYPSYINTDGNKLAVVDYYNSRILIWKTLPVSDVPADIVTGQSDFTSNACDTSQTGLCYPNSVFMTSDAVYVADYYNSRIIFWTGLNWTSLTGSLGAASGIIGQADWNSWDLNRGAVLPSANSLSYPWEVIVDNNLMYIVDSGNNRILEYDISALNGTPAGSSEEAISVFGQDDMSGNSANKSEMNMGAFAKTGCYAVSDDYLIVSSRYDSRVLVFKKDGLPDGEDAIAVIGQDDEESRCSVNNDPACDPPSSSNSNMIEGCAVDAQDRLYLSDRYNNRVLVYNQIPTSTGAGADYVLGQSDFFNNISNSGVDGRGWLNQPGSMSVIDNKLFVSDINNDRVLIYNLPIHENQQHADVVIGQDNFNTVGGNTNSQNRINVPGGILGYNGRLFISTYQSRILVYNSIPSSNGVLADYVIGQTDFTGNISGTTQVNFADSMFVDSMLVLNNHLFVPDRYNYRILGFDLNNLSNGMSASYVIGQDNFTTNENNIGNKTGTAFDNFSGPAGIMADTDGNYIYIADYFASRIIRIRTDKFWNYVQ